MRSSGPRAVLPLRFRLGNTLGWRTKFAPLSCFSWPLLPRNGLRRRLGELSMSWNRRAAAAAALLPLPALSVRGPEVDSVDTAVGRRE